jgi:hypothetical protein
MKETQFIFSEYRGRVPTRVTCSLCRERFDLSSSPSGEPTRAEQELRMMFEKHYAGKHSQPVGNETASLRLRQALSDLES